MSRVIKFRTFKRGKMEILREFNEHYIFFNDDGMQTIQDDMKLMQFTGLKSENGQDLFEGDVITFGNSDTLHKIVFSKKGYWLAECIGENDYNYDGRAMHCDDVWDIVIHGNIHENPELLK